MSAPAYPDNGRLPPNATSVDYTYWKDGDGLLINGGCSGMNAVYRDKDGKMVSQAYTKPPATSFIDQTSFRSIYDQNYDDIYGGV